MIGCEKLSKKLRKALIYSLVYHFASGNLVLLKDVASNLRF